MEVRRGDEGACWGMMRPNTFQFRLGRGQARGVPSVLVLLVGGVVLAGVVALVLFLGAIVAVAGLAASVGAALYFGARRWLGKGLFAAAPRVRQVESRPVSAASNSSSSSPLQVREIEVEVLPEKQR